jgi:hypothetical protein
MEHGVAERARIEFGRSFKLVDSGVWNEKFAGRMVVWI